MSVEPLRSPTQPRVLRVSELNRVVRGALEDGFRDVWVEGEITQAKRAPSGHLYFNLSDEHDPAQVACVMFRSDAQRTRAKTLLEMADKSRPFFGELTSLDEEAMAKHLMPAVAAPLRDLRDRLMSHEPWQAAGLHSLIESVAAAHDMKLGKIAQPLRVAVTGFAASPAIDITLQLVGREQCIIRLDGALAYIASREQSG